MILRHPSAASSFESVADVHIIDELEECFEKCLSRGEDEWVFR
jgi:hypothetical protein